MKTRYNVTVWPKQDTQEIYNRIYKNYPTMQQVHGCVGRYKKTRDTSTHNGVEIHRIIYKNGKQIDNREVS